MAVFYNFSHLNGAWCFVPLIVFKVLSISDDLSVCGVFVYSRCTAQHKCLFVGPLGDQNCMAQNLSRTHCSVYGAPFPQNYLWTGQMHTLHSPNGKEMVTFKVGGGWDKVVSFLHFFWLLDRCVAGSLSKSEQLFYLASTTMCVLDDPDVRNRHE